MIALPLMAMLWLFDSNPFSSEVTVHAVYCGKDTGDRGGCIDLPPITCRIFPERQEVVYWTDTGNPMVLTDCTVHDHKNGECWYVHRAGRMSMIDGRFHDEIRRADLDRDVFDSVRYVPKWKWWAVKIGINTDG